MKFGADYFWVLSDKDEINCASFRDFVSLYSTGTDNHDWRIDFVPEHIPVLKDVIRKLNSISKKKQEVNNG